MTTDQRCFERIKPFNQSKLGEFFDFGSASGWKHETHWRTRIFKVNHYSLLSTTHTQACNPMVCFITNGDDTERLSHIFLPSLSHLESLNRHGSKLSWAQTLMEAASALPKCLDFVSKTTGENNTPSDAPDPSAGASQNAQLCKSVKGDMSGNWGPKQTETSSQTLGRSLTSPWPTEP